MKKLLIVLMGSLAAISANAADARFTGRRRRQLEFLPAHHLGAAIGVYADCFGHGRSRCSLRPKPASRASTMACARLLTPSLLKMMEM